MLLNDGLARRIALIATNIMGISILDTSFAVVPSNSFSWFFPFFCCDLEDSCCCCGLEVTSLEGFDGLFAVEGLCWFSFTTEAKDFFKAVSLRCTVSCCFWFVYVYITSGFGGGSRRFRTFPWICSIVRARVADFFLGHPPYNAACSAPQFAHRGWERDVHSLCVCGPAHILQRMGPLQYFAICPCL